MLQFTVLALVTALAAGAPVCTRAASGSQSIPECQKD
jgi:hypothetical protein